MAVSAESMTASVPSKTALATSVTSARVGVGAEIMLSSICVAVITGTPAVTHERMIVFCRWGRSSRGQEIPRSPRATITASARSRSVGRQATAAAVSILATRRGPSGPIAVPHLVQVVRRAHERDGQVVDVRADQAPGQPEILRGGDRDPHPLGR